MEWYVELYYLPDLISKEKSTIQTTSKYEEKGKEKTIYFRYSPLYILKFALVVKLAIVSLNLVANLGRYEDVAVPAYLASTITIHAWIVTATAIRAKLAIDGPAIGDSTAQFYYVYLNLVS